jgi:hypothetical protein
VAETDLGCVCMFRLLLALEGNDNDEEEGWAPVLRLREARGVVIVLDVTEKSVPRAVHNNG